MGTRGTCEVRRGQLGERVRLGKRIARQLPLLIALVVGLWGLPVNAQQRAAAELLFDEGKKAMDAGDFTQACAKFEEE